MFNETNQIVMQDFQIPQTQEDTSSFTNESMFIESYNNRKLTSKIQNYKPEMANNKLKFLRFLPIRMKIKKQKAERKKGELQHETDVYGEVKWIGAETKEKK